MKKKVLFVMESLGIGGAEKSLVTLLSQFDYSKYEVDLFLFNPTGEFMDLLPSEVNLLPSPEDFKNYISSPKDSIRYLCKHRKLKLLICKMIEVATLIINKFLFHKEYIGWRYISQSIDVLPNEYDVAIGFLEKKSIYFTVDKVVAKKKIGWIHIDYEKIEHNHKMDDKYFKHLNSIVTVSQHCKDVLVHEFPQYKDKVKIIQNIISPTLIKAMSDRKVEDLKIIKEASIICTVCRLTEQKGIDIAIECCEQLVKRGLTFKWIVVGDGPEKLRLQNMIEQKRLTHFFEIIGAKANPYPYMKQCDVYVQPSRYEGFGITVAEAKVLAKPILANAIPEFIEQLEHQKTGILYKSFDEMVNELEKLLINKDYCKKLSQNLKDLVLNNRNEILKLERLLEE